MPSVVWLCIGWVFASVGVACLPIRKQFVPAGILLLAAPVLIVMIGLQFGWIFALLGLAAFISMFRNPLRYLAARLRGENPELPR
ncbi:DUF2484 family protein [Sulfitobacter donghicola]